MLTFSEILFYNNQKILNNNSYPQNCLNGVKTNPVEEVQHAEWQLNRDLKEEEPDRKRPENNRENSDENTKDQVRNPCLRVKE